MKFAYKRIDCLTPEIFDEVVKALDSLGEYHPYYSTDDKHYKDRRYLYITGLGSIGYGVQEKTFLERNKRKKVLQPWDIFKEALIQKSYCPFKGFVTDLTGCSTAAFDRLISVLNELCYYTGALMSNYTYPHNSDKWNERSVIYITNTGVVTWYTSTEANIIKALPPRKQIHPYRLFQCLGGSVVDGANTVMPAHESGIQPTETTVEKVDPWKVVDETISSEREEIEKRLKIRANKLEPDYFTSGDYDGLGIFCHTIKQED